MAEPLPWKVQLLEARLRGVIGRQLSRFSKSGSGKPGEGEPTPPRKPSFKGWPATNVAMYLGRALPHRLLEPGVEGRIFPTASTRAVDAALDRIAAAKETREAEPTRFAFIPRPGMVIKFKSPVDGGTEYARVSDWGAQGLTAWTKEHGEVKVAWRDARAATERELEARRQAEDDWHEAQGANTSRWAAEDLRPGLRVTAIDGDQAGGGEEVPGTIEAVMPDRGGYVVLRAQGGLRAFRVSDVVMIHAAPEQPVAKSWSVDILDDDEADEVEG